MDNDKYIGRILDNRYEILELIGSGGMAYVYKALCHRLNRLVAIKILKDELAVDEEFQRRFYTESQAIAMLSHPNIVAVYDVSRSGTTEYIVMELIEGITLKQYMSRKGLLTWKETLHFATQIIKALTHAHSRGIIHRDIKPHNIMILKDGSIKVADFGIARLLAMQNTMTQDSLGSVHYISPEQAKGGLVDARSDIYSVGVVMYEMLTGRLPFVGETAVSVAIQHISAIPLQPRDINPEIPIGLEEITMHAMEPDIDSRFATADEMLADLEDFRKNPAYVFNYSSSNPADRLSAGSQVPYQTRIIPRDAISKPARQGAMPVITPRPKTDLSSEEYRDAKRVSRSTATLIGILAVVIVVTLLFILLVMPTLSEWFNRTEEYVHIPNFIDRNSADVIHDPQYASQFTFEIELVNSIEKPEGVIINQDPGPDTQRSMPLDGDKIKIRLIVSDGDKPPIEMPDLTGMHYGEARNTLLNLSLANYGDTQAFTIDYQFVQDNTRADGEVFETIPGHGDLIARGYTIIIRYAIPEGERMVLVPDLVGRTREIAQQQLDELDLEIIWLEDYDENIPEDCIAFVQNANESVPAWSTVQIIVSLGPRETPTPEPPEETPEPTPPDGPVDPPPDDTPADPPPPDDTGGEENP